MKEEASEDKEAASPAEMVGQEAEQNGEDNPGDRRSCVGQSDSQRPIFVHPTSQGHESGYVRCCTAEIPDDALVLVEIIIFSLNNK